MRFLLLLTALFVSIGASGAQPIPLPAEHINSTMNMAQKKAREAAVKITTPLGGHGSGSYIVYKDAHLVLTAQHVTDGPLGSNYPILKDGEVRIATLIWADPAADMALLYLSERFKNIQPIRWDPQPNIASVGKMITYSGYPSTHKLMTFHGVVAGYGDNSEVGKQIILNTYGWFGCSGSVIYTLSGQIVGVLYGVDVEYSPSLQIQENMIWVAPIQRLKIEEALKPLCNGMPRGHLRACR